MESNERFPRGVEVVGSAIIENASGEILLVRAAKWNNKWTLPGGHIEPGEKIEDALLREAQEEVGLRLQPHGVIAFGELINSKDFHRPAHFIFFDIYCTAVNEAVRLDGRELQEYVWVVPKKALTMDLAESYEKTIQDFLAFKKPG